MLTFVKLGGSVITDKTGQEAPDLATIRRLAGELRDALAIAPGLRLILGHGSGSFGHTYAARYSIHHGIAPGGDWLGFALIAWDTAAIGHALAHRLVPVVHGDVAFDEAQGAAIISTEQLLLYLARNTPDLRPTRIILVGEAGVYTADPRVNPQAQRIPSINRDNIAAVRGAAGGSHGADVTGGMRGKLELLWRMVESQPGLTAQLIGTTPGLLTRALLGQAGGEGTTIAV